MTREDDITQNQATMESVVAEEAKDPISRQVTTMKNSVAEEPKEPSEGQNDKGVRSDGNKKTRGMKPRSQRNRKRPRSQLYSNDNLTFETDICRIELDGKPVNVSNPWI
jgi:hypothetical protein